MRAARAGPTPLTPAGGRCSAVLRGERGGGAAPAVLCGVSGGRRSSTGGSLRSGTGIKEDGKVNVGYVCLNEVLMLMLML